MAPPTDEPAQLIAKANHEQVDERLNDDLSGDDFLLELADESSDEEPPRTVAAGGRAGTACNPFQDIDDAISEEERDEVEGPLPPSSDAMIL